jgi:tryptophan-rich sensory protein
VWSALYLLMAVAAWLVWRRAGLRTAGRALGLFSVQLILNVAWSGVFFGLRSPAAALVEIVLLWVAIAATIAAFSRTSSVASWIMVPYLAWVTFAGALNLAIWRLNG